MPCLDLIFSLIGRAVTREHAYSLYSAVSGLVPYAHSAKEVGIFSIHGAPVANGLLALNGNSILRIRLPETRTRQFLPLAGKAIAIDGHTVRVGVPRVASLVPAPSLHADMVLIKIAGAQGKPITADLFLAAARKQLQSLNIAAEPAIPVRLTGPHAGQPQRKVLKVKEQTHVGFSLTVAGLTPEESLRLQERGIGGRRLMGCGLFMPSREGQTP